MSDQQDLAHDQELYAFEGWTNAPLEPNSDIRDALYAGWENGFDQGYRRALRDALKLLQGVVPYNFELNPDARENHRTRSYVEGVYDSWAAVRHLIGEETDNG